MDEDERTVHHSDLVIDEIREDPTGRDERHLTQEYVVFRNDGSDTLDISKWSVENEAGDVFTFPDGTDVDAGERITLHTGTGVDAESDVYWGADRPVWHNAGDTVVVRDADGVVRIRESYNE